MKTLEQLANPALLSLAAKKAHRFLNRHSWYFDRADAAKFSGRLNFNIQMLSNELLSGQYMPSGKLALAAPKRIEIHEDGRKKYVVRPLCAYPFRDQVVEAALVCLRMILKNNGVIRVTAHIQKQFHSETGFTGLASLTLALSGVQLLRILHRNPQLHLAPLKRVRQAFKFVNY